MTWFKEPNAHLNKEGEDGGGMGANGSTHGGRLKSRSQSSSALYCIKSGSYIGNPGITAIDSRGQGDNGSESVSRSIPADLWDLPPTTKSYSPITRKHSSSVTSRPTLTHQQSADYPSHYCQQHQQQQQQQGQFHDNNVNNQQPTKHRGFPFVDAFINRASGKRDGKSKGLRERSGSVRNEDIGESGRGKFYAVSCPDVAQEAAMASRREGGSFSHHHPQNFQNFTNDVLPPVHYQDHYSEFSNNSCPQHPQQLYYQVRSFGCEKHPDVYCQYFPTDGEGRRKSMIAFPFISEADIFEVRLRRDPRGLGLSVTGGSDSQESYPGLIRVKTVFPMGPAYQSGRLRPWDIILKANGIPLTGLTNHEALEVLRTTPIETILTVCRPPGAVPEFSILEQSNNSKSQPQLSQSSTFYPNHQQFHFQHSQPTNPSHPHDHPHNFQQQQQQHSTATSTSAFNPSIKSKSLSSLKIPQPLQNNDQPFGEFEVTLEKLGGSLGFTLRQEDTSILGHYVRALVKEPALSDGRIQPGDRILSVNGVDLSGVSHADAIGFLRQCPPRVTLRLYRDVSPTPISPLSPTESHKTIKTKPLRQEAIDMLHDLALRKKLSGSEASKSSRSGSATGPGRTGLRGHKALLDLGTGPATLPRRKQERGQPTPPGVTPSPQVISAALDRFAGRATPKPKENVELGSPQRTLKKRGELTGSQPPPPLQPQHCKNYPSETRSSGSGESTQSTPHGTLTQHGRYKIDRGNSHGRAATTDLLSSGSNKDWKGGEGHRALTHKDSLSDDDSSFEDGGRERELKKPSFRQFSLHLDRISSLEDESFSSDLNQNDSIVSEPCFATSPESRRKSEKAGRDNCNFLRGQPAYQSAVLSSSSNTGSGSGSGGGRSMPKRSSREDSARELSDVEPDSPSNHLSLPSSQEQTQSPQDEEEEEDDKSATTPEPPEGTTIDKRVNKLSDSGGSSCSLASSTTDNMTASSSKSLSGGLLKWKGVLFSQDDKENEDEDDLQHNQSDNINIDSKNKLSSSTSSSRTKNKGGQQDRPTSCANNRGDQENVRDKNWRRDGKFQNGEQRRSSPDGSDFRDCDNAIEISNSATQLNGETVFTVQLSRRWCSRLGFSLQGLNGHTFISAVYPDSVASNDGRLRVGDEIIMVNGETIRDVETTQVIDVMRKTRGVIDITILRKPGSDLRFSDYQLGLT